MNRLKIVVVCAAAGFAERRRRGAVGVLAFARRRAARRARRGATALPDGGVRGVLVKAAGEKSKPYAGTALYSLAEDSCATSAQEAATKRGPPVFVDSFRLRGAWRSAPTCCRVGLPEGGQGEAGYWDDWDD